MPHGSVSWPSVEQQPWPSIGQPCGREDGEQGDECIHDLKRAGVGACCLLQAAEEPAARKPRQVTFTLDGDFSSFDSERQSALLSALAGKLGIDATRIRYLSMRAGSIILTLEIDDDMSVGEMEMGSAWSAVKKAKTGSGLPEGPGGVLGLAEGLAYLCALGGLFVLAGQVTDFGFIPNAVPVEGGRCFS